MAVEGVSIASSARVKRLSWNTVARWRERAAEAARRFNDRMTHGYELRELQADEIRTFVHRKDSVLWVFAAVEVWSRLWPSAVVGRRSYRNTQQLMRETAANGLYTVRSLITTDGFLWSRKELAARGLTDRKGFPESYDVRRLVQFMADLKAGAAEVCAPVYSHLAYDIVEGETHCIRRPDIVIVEGLNVLQTGTGRAPMFVSDFFDFSMYVDAHEADIEQWYVERFLTLHDTVFRDPSSYFHRYADLSRAEATDVARGVWQTINLVNLRENVLPTRERAYLILEKGRDHAVRRVKLRKL